jgi:hypothetical protein
MTVTHVVEHTDLLAEALAEVVVETVTHVVEHTDLLAEFRNCSRAQ